MVSAVLARLTLDYFVGSLRLWCLSWSTQCLEAGYSVSLSPLTSPFYSQTHFTSHPNPLTTTPTPPATSTPSPPPPKRYTFLLKDEVLPLRTDGREQSTISYEYEFQADDNPTTDTAGAKDTTTTITIPWSELRATYRGKDTPDARAINLGEVRRISFMMRRYVVFVSSLLFSSLPFSFHLVTRDS